MSTAQKTIAFFGATGGVTGSALASALKDGVRCTALARNPDKLRQFLITEHSVPASVLDSQLTIFAGDIQKSDTIEPVLKSPLNPSVLVDTIVSGVGSLPKLQWSLFHPITLQTPNICETGIQAVFDALASLASHGITTSQDGRKPLITVCSTTGITNGARDIPLLYWIPYKIFLHIPHIDKRAMELKLFNDNGEHFRDYVIVRPTILTDAEPRGLQSVRAGWEWGNRAQMGEEREKEPGPQLGYTIGRKDVGKWIYEKPIKEGGWEGKCASLTY